MRSLLLAILLLPALSQAQLQIDIGLPSIRFEVQPPLVVVQPGVQVVENYDHDVFVVGGVYWMVRDDHWYRANDWRGGWVEVERRAVPVQIVDVRPGKYRHWKAAKPPSGEVKPASHKAHDDHDDDKWKQDKRKDDEGKGKGKHKHKGK